jgi:tetratricopeptide (TPR) repeat protein
VNGGDSEFLCLIAGLLARTNEEVERRCVEDASQMKDGMPSRREPAMNWRGWKALTTLTLAAALLTALLLAAPFSREARLQRLDLDALRRAAGARPNDPELFLLLGRRLRQSGERRQALVITQRAYDLSDGSPRFVAAKAGVLLDAAEGEEAYRLLKNSLARWPDSGELRAQLARAYAARGLFTDALREAEAAVRLAPRHAEAWQALGNACSSNKRPARAFAAFVRALELEPHDAELLADYGEALAKYGRSAEAESMLTRSVALVPRAARPHALLGHLKATRAGTAAERDIARGLLERALALAPAATDTQYHLALLNLRDGRDQEAIRLLQSCLAQDPGYGEAHLALGQAYRRTGQEAAARRAFAAWHRFSDYRRQATHLELRLRRSPMDQSLMRRLADLHAAQGRTELAEQYRRRIRALEAGIAPDRQMPATGVTSPGSSSP